MGNTTSGEGFEQVPISSQNWAQLDDCVATAGDNPLDLSVLFNRDALFKALANVRELPGTAIQKNTGAITKWLKAKLDNNEFFVDVDCEEEGVVDINYLLSALQDSDPLNALQPCHILPSPVDVYLDGQSAGTDVWKKLVKFLKNRRVQSSRLTLPAQSHQVSMFHNREKLVNGRYNMYLEMDKDTDMVFMDGVDDEEMATRCYSKITVSTNEKDIPRLMDGRVDTYWQSNPSYPTSGKQWIRLHMLPGVIVKELAIAVNATDNSFMPKDLTVSAGYSEAGLRELKTVTVPKCAVKNGAVGTKVVMRVLVVGHEGTVVVMRVLWVVILRGTVVAILRVLCWSYSGYCGGHTQGTVAAILRVLWRPYSGYCGGHTQGTVVAILRVLWWPYLGYCGGHTQGTVVAILRVLWWPYSGYCGGHTQGTVVVILRVLWWPYSGYCGGHTQGTVVAILRVLWWSYSGYLVVILRVLGGHTQGTVVAILRVLWWSYSGYLVVILGTLVAILRVLWWSIVTLGRSYIKGCLGLWWELTGKLVLVQNLRKDYRYVQVNINSDTCTNTRVRGIFVKGFNSEERESSVLDTMAAWYFDLMTSTAMAAMPAAPGLRDDMLAQSMQAFGSLRPLVLSPTSSLKPEFLSPFVVKKIDRFLTQLCLPGDKFMSVDRDSLQVLLVFALARGNVNSILTCLQILLDNCSLEFPVSAISKLDEIQRDKEYRHAKCVNLVLVLCDGGEMDDTHKAENALTNELSQDGNPYVSATGKTVVNFLLKQSEDRFIKTIRVTIEGQSGSQGAKMGLVFCTDSSKDKTPEALLKEYDQYNGWTADDYERLNEERAQGKHLDPSAPIGYFKPAKESPVTSITIDVIKPGSYILIKFLGTIGADAERMGVHCIKVYGYSLSQEDIDRAAFVDRLNTLAPLPFSRNATVPGNMVLLKVLGFVTLLLQDLASLQSSRRSVSLDPAMLGEAHLASNSIYLDKIWSLYISLTIHSSEELRFCSVLCLHLLRASLPFIRPTREKNVESATLTTVLVHLCGLLDSESTDPVLRKLAQDIVVEGMEVFFPDARTRKECFLSMINTIWDGEHSTSWWFKFEVLCVYFSQSNGHSLLELPKTITRGKKLNTDTTRSIFTTVIDVAQKEAIVLIGGGSVRSDKVVKLLSALQSLLFFWCRKHITTGEEGIRKEAAQLLEQYVSKFSSSCAEVLEALVAVSQKTDSLLDAIAKTTVGCILPQMITLLSCVATLPIDRLSLLGYLKCLVKPLQELASQLPTRFFDVDSPALGSVVMEEAVIGMWMRESSTLHGDITEEFASPLAVKFVVEFDPRCHTKQGYMCGGRLEFTDSLDQKTTFYDEYGLRGSKPLPKTLIFTGSKLQFHCRPRAEKWKFTVKAYGRTIPPLYCLNDLQLALAQLLGKLCSVTLSTKSLHMPITDEKEEKAVKALLHSDLWKTLFRGGYQEDSNVKAISGVHITSSNSSVSTLLHDLASGVESPKVIALLDICQAETKRHTYGGRLVDRTVNAVFAAFICHTEELREELTPFGELTATANLMTAYLASEAMRRDLVEARQKLMEAKEREEDLTKRANIDEDAPVKACLKKAQYLLKFPGLSKAQQEDKISSPLVRPTWATKGKHWQVSTAVNTVEKLKQQLQGSSNRENLTEKCPSFELVLNFVKNDAISEEQVHFLLQQRAQFARCTDFVYSYASDYLRAIGTSAIFELTGLIFLQYLLSEQRHFPFHYASKMNGCDLELENCVRRSYHNLLATILDAINVYLNPLATNGIQVSSDRQTSQSLVSTYLLHLLDYQWQNYDCTLISDLQLPEFLLQTAIKSGQEEKGARLKKFDKEDEMMKLYELHMTFLEKWKAAASPKAAIEAIGQKKELRLFLVCKRAFASHMSEISCTLCHACYMSECYHSLDCNANVTLCGRCFYGDNRPGLFSTKHLFQAINRRFGCAGCGLAIISHRFKSQTRTDYNLCLGCFRKEESQGHAGDSWLVYPLTEQPEKGQANKYLTTDPECCLATAYKDGFIQKMESRNDFSVYNTHHAWMLFSVICLFVASNVNNQQTGVHSRKAGTLLAQCIQLLGYMLRAALVGRLEDAGKSTKVPPKDEMKADIFATEGTFSSAGCGNGGKTVEISLSPPSTAPMDTVTVSSNEATPLASAAPPTSEAPPAPTAPKPVLVESHQQLSFISSDELSKIGQAEKAFGALYLESILCLLAAILPQLTSLQPWIESGIPIEELLAETFLPTLTAISNARCFTEAQNQLALLLATKYMSKVTPEIGDRAVSTVCGCSSGGKMAAGVETAQYLLEKGNVHLKGGQCSNAIATARCFSLLSRVVSWKPAINDSIDNCLQSLLEDKLDHIFGFLVAAGFPRVLKEGATVSKHIADEGNKKAVVTTVKSESDEVVIVDLCTREPSTVQNHLDVELPIWGPWGASRSGDGDHGVKLTAVEMEDSVPGCIDKSQLDSLMCILTVSLQLTEQKAEMSVERTWVLGLALKALNCILSAPDSEDVVSSVVDEGILPSIVKLAGRPTNLSTKWHLSDLEVLGIQAYQHISSVPEPAKPGVVGEARTQGTSGERVAPGGPEVTLEEEEEPDVKSKPTPPPKPGSHTTEALKKTLAEREEEKALEGVPTDVRSMLKFKVYKSLEAYNQFVRGWVKDICAKVVAGKYVVFGIHSKELGGIHFPDELVEAAKKWDINIELAHETAQEDSGIFQVMPIPVDLNSVEAVPEHLSTSGTSAELMNEGKETMAQEGEDHTAEESYKLLKEELAKIKQKPNKKQILKIHQGIVVMWARSVVRSVLERWPMSHKLSLVQLGCSSTTEYFSLLDLLLRGHTAEQCKQCMREVSVGMEIRDIRPLLAGKNSEGGKIVVLGASRMRVTFDQTCILPGTVIVSSSEDLSEDSYSLFSSSTGPQKWTEHSVPGNTIYYKVTLDDESNSTMKLSRFSFSVVGIQTGRFDTGYSILRALLSEEKDIIFKQIYSLLPLSDLWSNLICLACQVTGKQRLKILGLLVRLVQLCKTPAPQSTDATTMVSGLERLNLSALKPLWQLYTKLIEDYERKERTGYIRAPEIVRAMTELFFVVENLAEDWGITRDVLLDMLTKEELSTWLEKGISNVALISLALGLDNVASNAFVDAKPQTPLSTSPQLFSPIQLPLPQLPSAQPQSNLANDTTTTTIATTTTTDNLYITTSGWSFCQETHPHSSPISYCAGHLFPVKHISSISSTQSTQPYKTRFCYITAAIKNVEDKASKCRTSCNPSKRLI
eukprot:Em0012g462a